MKYTLHKIHGNKDDGACYIVKNQYGHNETRAVLEALELKGDAGMSSGMVPHRFWKTVRALRKFCN